MDMTKTLEIMQDKVRLDVKVENFINELKSEIILLMQAHNVEDINLTMDDKGKVPCDIDYNEKFYDEEAINVLILNSHQEWEMAEIVGVNIGNKRNELELVIIDSYSNECSEKYAQIYYYDWWNLYKRVNYILTNQEEYVK